MTRPSAEAPLARLQRMLYNLVHRRDGEYVKWNPKFEWVMSDRDPNLIWICTLQKTLFRYLVFFCFLGGGGGFVREIGRGAFFAVFVFYSCFFFPL